jgi:hypothetical protein
VQQGQTDRHKTAATAKACLVDPHQASGRGPRRDLAMFNLAIDSKLRGCDVVALKVEDIAPNGYALVRATTAHRINRGSILDLSPPSTDSDFYFVQADLAGGCGGAHRRTGQDKDTAALQARPCPGHPGSLPNEPRRDRRSRSQTRQVAMNPAGERKVEIRLDLRARRAP